MADPVDVILAHPWNGHAPKTRVTVDEATARRLVRGGYAQPARAKKAAATAKKAAGRSKPKTG